MACALCLKDIKLCDSHIYPEFLYRKVYDLNHTFYKMSGDKDVVPKKQRKGVYEKLLCNRCEKQICIYEDYAAKVLNGGVRIDVKQLRDKIVASNIQYDKFKLFQLSILWRSGTSQQSEFNNLRLGPHQEILRKMILSNNPGEPHEYGCFMSFASDNKEIMQRVIYPLEPLYKKYAGFHIYRGVFGGFFWAYIVSSHNILFPHREVFLSKEGVLKIFLAPPSAKNFLSDIDKIISSSKEKI